MYIAMTANKNAEEPAAAMVWKEGSKEDVLRHQRSLCYVSYAGFRFISLWTMMGDIR